MASTETTALVTHWDQVLKGRRSVRRYLPRPVPDDDLAAVLDAARWAASPHNAQPWRFVILRHAASKERLALAMGQRWSTDLARDGRDAAAIAAEVRRSYRRITEAPVVVIACVSTEGLDEYPDPQRQAAERLMAAQSLGAAVQNLMLAAYARGLGTCWMCAPLFCPDVVVETLALPPRVEPQALITLGYPAGWPDPRPRRPVSDLVIAID